MARGPDRLSVLQLRFCPSGPQRGATSDRGYGLDQGCSNSATLRPAGRWSGFALAVGGWQLLLPSPAEANLNPKQVVCSRRPCFAQAHGRGASLDVTHRAPDLRHTGWDTPAIPRKRRELRG